MVDDGLPGLETRGSRSDWYRQLGESHRRRGESAALDLRRLQSRERQQERTARLRWPGIVAAVRTNISRYNQGAGLEVLTLIDDSDADTRALVVTDVARTGPTLTLTVSGAEFCARPNPITAGAADDGRLWITLQATDEAIADYALQDWLTRL